MLAEMLKKLLATEFAFYLKAHGFHWNVEGPDFGELHVFFGRLAEEVYENSIDRTAEFIRTLDEYSPASFERYSQLSVLTEQTKIPRARLMLEELNNDNGQVIGLLNDCFRAAAEENQEGIANFIAERLDAHGKHGWMLRAYLKESRA